MVSFLILEAKSRRPSYFFGIWHEASGNCPCLSFCIINRSFV